MKDASPTLSSGYALCTRLRVVYSRWDRRDKGVGVWSMV